MLGSTTEDDPSKGFQNKSFFGNIGGKASNKHIHSVALDITKDQQTMPIHKLSNAEDFPKQSAFIVKGREKDILEGFNMLRTKLPSFDLVRFHKNSQIAFDLIIQAGIKNDEDELRELIDPRYVEHFKGIAANYTNLLENVAEIQYEISEIYMFGNTAFVKVMFTQNADKGVEAEFHEEWTFSRNILAPGKTWYLSNVDKM